MVKDKIGALDNPEIFAIMFTERSAIIMKFEMPGECILNVA